jgi:hypothetical protein
LRDECIMLDMKGGCLQKKILVSKELGAADGILYVNQGS